MYFKIVMTNSHRTGIGLLKSLYATEKGGAFLLHTDMTADALKEELLRTADGVEIVEISQQECWKLAGFPADSPFVLDSKRK
jgi:hypothetical protein